MPLRQQKPHLPVIPDATQQSLIGAALIRDLARVLKLPLRSCVCIAPLKERCDSHRMTGEAAQRVAAAK